MSNNYKGDEPKYVAKELAELTHQNFKLQQRITELEANLEKSQECAGYWQDECKKLEAEKEQWFGVAERRLEELQKLKEAIELLIEHYEKRRSNSYPAFIVRV
jgi:septal ring factor EnvC (AmiA/AmiB activator)